MKPKADRLSLTTVSRSGSDAIRANGRHAAKITPMRMAARIARSRSHCRGRLAGLEEIVRGWARSACRNGAFTVARPDASALACFLISCDVGVSRSAVRRIGPAASSAD
jgi:hypothetical protein